MNRKEKERMGEETQSNTATENNSSVVLEESFSGKGLRYAVNTEKHLVYFSISKMNPKLQRYQR